MPAPEPLSAEFVGDVFVKQYYALLSSAPDHVYRFYKDISKLGRPGDDGYMSITTTMKGINEKILSLNYGDFRTQIKSVDSQESFYGGVQVFVNGNFIGKDNKNRRFAQTFFLAPQPRGYFVLNDILRYVEDEDQENLNPSSVPNHDAVAHVAPEQNSPPPPAQEEKNVAEISSTLTEEGNGGWEVFNLLEPEKNEDTSLTDESSSQWKRWLMNVSRNQWWN